MQKKFYHTARITLLSLSVAVLAFPEDAFSQEFSMAANATVEKRVARINSSEEALVPLEDVFGQLEKRYNVHFTYNQKVLEGLKVRAVDPSAKELEEVLDGVLKTNGLKYKKYSKPENTYFIFHGMEQATPDRGSEGAKPAAPIVQAT